MGLLNKLKNVLFEEEEIEDVKEEKNISVSNDTVQLPKINREPKKETYDVENEPDTELFKSEKTFDFPVFDEEEFEDFSPKKKEEKIVKPFERDKNESRINNNYSRKKDYTSTRIVKSTYEAPKKAFKPSPVISPVYGILDKNYKKEDVVTRDEIIEKKNLKLDVDSVRKKAFGTLEEDLSTTLAKTVEEFYDENDAIDNSVNDFLNESVEEDIDVTVNDLLEKTIDEEIDVTKEMEIPSRVSKKYKDEEQEILEDKKEEDVEDIIDDSQAKKVENLDDTLESDLFELIDSMYENREDEN